MDQFRGKVAIVTGASAGIGAATVKALLEAGMDVVGIARRKNKIEDIRETVEHPRGKLYAVGADVTKEDDVVRAFKWATDNAGPVHVLINNAGVASNTNIIDGDSQKWRNILDVNLFGLAVASREAVKIMRDNGVVHGHIVNINSVAGHAIPNFPTVSLYPASKHAVTAFTETLRLELIRLGSKIKITSLSPGLVATDIFEANGIMTTERFRELTKETKCLESEDIASAIIYVLNTPPHVQVTELTIRPVGELI